MDLLVQPNSNDPTHGRLTCGDATYDCALGRSGITTNKTEGDGATPVGTFALRRVFFRTDRVHLPKTKLVIQAISNNDGWCDAPSDPRYNTLVQHPYPASAEHLWRDDHRYDVIVVLGYNDDPVVPGDGSAIFLHVAAEDFRPTEGCIALRVEDVLEIIGQCDTASTITIQKV